MRILPLATAALVLTGCASTETTIVAATPAADVDVATAPAADVDPESIVVAAVVDLEDEPSGANELRCEQETVVGSRISRQRCYRTLSEAEEQLNADMKRSEIDYARDIALLEEQRRMEEFARRSSGDQ